MKYLRLNQAKKKIMSIGQSIMKAARPRTMIAPLQVCFNKVKNLSYIINFLKNIVHRLVWEFNYIVSIPLNFWLTISMLLDSAHRIPKLFDLKEMLQ